MVSKDQYFYMPLKEMTIMLDDISTLLGILVVGWSVSLPTKRVSNRKVITLLVRELGVSSQYAGDETTSSRCQSVQMEWLRELFGNVIDHNDGAEIKCAIKVYLLFLLGCTLFCDKSTWVLVNYLKLLSDLGTVQEYAWGVIALAYLYRHLGIVSRASVLQMARYVTLLEGWIYEYFPDFAPHRNIYYGGDKP